MGGFQMNPILLKGMLLGCGLLASMASAAQAQGGAQQFVVYEGQAGPGKGKHVVLLSGDEEYRSEEALPMLGRILAGRYGFKCTILFSVHKTTGEIDPGVLDNNPGLSALATADLAVVFLRFREWPDTAMKHFADYLKSGKPIIGLRTATHAFNYVKNPSSPYAKYSFRSTGYPGGFGKQVLGETWIDHWGSHGSQSTRGVIRAASKDHVILKGVTDIWGPTDVYSTGALPADAQVLVDGQVLTGMKATDPPLAGKATMPICWVRTFTGEGGKPTRVFTSTIGASQDFQSEGLRRLFVNACFWGLQMEAAVPAQADVTYMTPYAPTGFGFGGHKKGVKPADLAWSPVPNTIGRRTPPSTVISQTGQFRPDGRRVVQGVEAWGIGGMR